MTQRIDSDRRRFREIVRGRIKRNLKQYISQGELIGKQGDKAVRLYNEAYYKPAKAMLDELKSKDLLKDNPWIDEFQITFYYLWHHQGRRARQGAMMGAPDYAHWHGFFELQQDLYKLEEIYKKRLESGTIE